MRTRTKAVGLLLVLVPSACLLLFALRPTEPQYAGKPLSFWIAKYDSDYVYPDNHDARDAIRTIGTNAFPFLLKWGSYTPPEWPAHLSRFLPNRDAHVIYYLLRTQSRAERADIAISAFSAFTTNAFQVIPLLTRLLADKHPSAIEALARFGPQGFPPLLMAWSNSTNLTERWIIENTVVEHLPPENEDTNLLPLLVSATHQPQEYFRTAASNALFQIAPQIATNLATQ